MWCTPEIHNLLLFLLTQYYLPKQKKILYIFSYCENEASVANKWKVFNLYSTNISQGQQKFLNSLCRIYLDKGKVLKNYN